MTNDQLMLEFYDELLNYDSTNEEHQNMLKALTSYIKANPEFKKKLKPRKLLEQQIKVQNNVKLPNRFEATPRFKPITLNIANAPINEDELSTIQLPEFVVTKTINPRDYKAEAAKYVLTNDEKTMLSRMKAVLNSRLSRTGKALYKEGDGRVVDPLYFMSIISGHLLSLPEYRNPKFNALNGFILPETKTASDPIPMATIVYDNGREAKIGGNALRYMLNKMDMYPYKYLKGGHMQKSQNLKNLEKFVTDLGFLSGAKSDQEAVQTGTLLFELLRLNLPLLLQALMQIWSDAESKQEGTGKLALILTLKNAQTLSLSSQAFLAMNGAPASYGLAYLSKNGSKLLHLQELNGKCPEGYEIEKYLIGGCVKCKKGKKLKLLFNKTKRFTKGGSTEEPIDKEERVNNSKSRITKYSNRKNPNKDYSMVTVQKNDSSFQASDEIGPMYDSEARKKFYKDLDKYNKQTLKKLQGGIMENLYDPIEFYKCGGKKRIKKESGGELNNRKNANLIISDKCGNKVKKHDIGGSITDSNNTYIKEEYPYSNSYSPVAKRVKITKKDTNGKTLDTRSVDLTAYGDTIPSGLWDSNMSQYTDNVNQFNQYDLMFNPNSVYVAPKQPTALDKLKKLFGL